MPHKSHGPSRRAVLNTGAALLGASVLPAGGSAAAQVAPDTPPGGYNILYILVDQEHFFGRWPFPVPAREWIKANGITFTNHQAASCVCSPARSVIYTGQHIQNSGVYDNLNYLWQADLSSKVPTIGDRMKQAGYYPVYKGKWHLSYNLDQAKHAIDAPIAEYRKILQGYGFNDFYGVGDINDKAQGGYTFDDATSSTTISWLRTTGEDLRAKGQPWFMAVNFVNPHDVMYINSDLPGEVVQARKHAIPILPTPLDGVYQARWDDVPLPATRGQALDGPGRPKAHAIYQSIQDMMVGQWPNEDRRWRLLRNYYYNCIRDCDRQVMRVLDALRESGMASNTIIVFNADHGEMGGSHQMRGKGNCAYKEQNHLPLMVVHPAYPGGKTCQAITSQIDLAPSRIALTGRDAATRAKAAAGLPGRDFSALLRAPEQAGVDALRPASLFNYNMLSYQDAVWAERLIDFMFSGSVSNAEKIATMKKHEPNFHDRVAIRSIFDGRYRFSRYFSPLAFNTPATLETLLAQNDLELYDLQNDPDEVQNLAMDPRKNADLLLALNSVMTARITQEVGVDDGRFLPLRGGKWHFPPRSAR